MSQTRAVAKENVLIRAGICAVTILPHFGGKIASIRVGETELLQSPLAPYAPRTRAMDFAAGDASGWDECLPSVAACTVETAAGTARIPDHGDLWRVEWRDRRQWAVDSDRLGGGEALVTLRGDCFSLPLELERTVTLAESESGWELGLGYRVGNTGSFASPWSWAAHPLFAVDRGDRISLPNRIRTLRLEDSRDNRLGKSGDTISWPTAQSPNGATIDLSTAQSPGSAVGDKLFAGPFGSSIGLSARSGIASSHEGCASLERLQLGLRLTVQFEPSLTPYLGLWLCYGGWPDSPGTKQICVALEPSTAPVDSLATKGDWARHLEPGETSTWPMELHIERIEK